eukprot:4757560-Prymnesium_polylepis.1
MGNACAASGVPLSVPPPRCERASERAGSNPPQQGPARGGTGAVACAALGVVHDARPRGATRHHDARPRVAMR